MIKKIVTFIFSFLVVTGSYVSKVQCKEIESKKLTFEETKKKAWKLFYSGEYEKAIEIAKHTVKDEEKKFGSNTPNTVMPLNYMAELYTAGKDYIQAEKTYKKIIFIVEKWLGATHPKVADLKNNLAYFYYKQKKFSQAKFYFEEALKLYKINYGENHINVATALNNLSVLSEAEGKSVESEKYKNEAMLVEKKIDYPYHQSKEVRYPVRKGVSDYVYDAASLISKADAAKISQICENLLSEKKVLFFVVTIKSVNSFGAVGWDPLVYADTIYEKWAEKNSTADSGFLLFISEGERAIHVIEKGKRIPGLTTKLNRIKEEVILQAFRKNDFSFGILSGVKEIVKNITLFAG